MPILLEENYHFIGVLRPSYYSAARRVHAIVERTRPPLPQRRFSMTRAFYTAPRYSRYSSTYVSALCGSARDYPTIQELLRDGEVDRTGDILEVTCKHCKRMLDKYLGSFDLNSPDWEV